MRLTGLLLLALSSSYVYAGYRGNVDVFGLFGASEMKFGIENAPTSNTCSYFERHLKFDATTDAGKNMLSILLSASVADKSVNVWYTDSSAPGTDETNGCSPSSMATLTAVGFSF